MSRNLVAIVSSILFVVLAALMVFIPVPYVTWRPGSTMDVLGEGADGPILQINGVESFETSGELLMTTVSASRVDGNVSFPEALFAYLSEDSDTMPRDVIYPPGRTYQQVRDEAVAAMDTSRNNATVAALRAAGQQVTEMPVVATVTLSGPAADKLEPGDLIDSIDGVSVSSRDDVTAIIRRRAAGDPVVFKIIREGSTQTISVVTSTDTDSRPLVGISVATGYLYGPEVVYHIDSSVVGPSAGLVFALAIYDKLTNTNLLGDSIVAGTGEIDAAGKVSGIGGIRAKIAGARKAGAEVFLLPSSNCADVGDIPDDLQLVPVGSLKDAIAALQLIKEGHKTMEVPRCE